ncbi:HAD-IA family hydrolase [Caldichromatium japonicum]|uniref:HAD-IA family hydrolase n=2 Tax=Caldichromatium japonicum TaxID=2699430 RepID=A0A6G7VHF0_9GAMM|nr:HAD-IA family hydrolase [Caldichromatium japonicum]
MQQSRFKPTDELKAIIFDVDGTIAETERDGHRCAFNAAFAAAGLDWYWDPVLYGELLAVAGGKERIGYFLGRTGIQPAGIDPDALAAELHRAKTVHYLDLVQSGAIPLRPGVLRLWREARAHGVRLAIATTAAPEGVRVLLERSGGAGVADWFEVIAAGDIVPNKKPAPDVYLYVLERLGLGPEACVAIEDSDNGARAALAAGIRALVVTINDYTAQQDFSGVPLVVDGLGEAGAPPRVLQGELYGRQCVDLETLRLLRRQVWSSRGPA